VTVNLIVDEHTYTETLVAHALAPASALDDVVDPDLAQRRCEASTGTPVHPDDILTAPIHAHIRRVVLDSVGVVTNMGRRRRLFTGAAREAAQLSARRCSRRGCTVPAEPCDIDHIHEHAKGRSRPTLRATEAPGNDHIVDFSASGDAAVHADHAAEQRRCGFDRDRG